MPPPSVPCSPHDARIQCDTRRAASAAGEMYYDFHHGWIFPAENRAWPRDMIRNCTPPYGWPFCPHCGGQLPKMADICKRALAEPDEGEGVE